MRKALIIGIDSYENVAPLYGCVNDSFAVKSMLDRHADGSFNFGVRHIVATGKNAMASGDELRGAIQELFAGDGEVALLYFAGHGHIESTGGYLCSSDVKTGNDGLAIAEIMTMANQSRIANRVIILDSCHSGVAGGNALQQKVAEVSDGVTILTASTDEQYASEENGAGIFTSLLVDALGGAAANLVGEVTPGGVYAHVDQSLGPWAQRPVFKTNVKRFVSLRKVQPPLELAELRGYVFLPQCWISNAAGSNLRTRTQRFVCGRAKLSAWSRCRPHRRYFQSFRSSTALDSLCQKVHLTCGTQRWNQRQCV